MITATELATYVGADEGEYSTLLEACVAEAVVLVDKYVGEVWDEDTQTYVPRPVPDPILDRAYTEVAADLFNRRSAPNGILGQQYATPDGVGMQPIRIARDPMQSAYKILGRWVLPF